MLLGIPLFEDASTPQTAAFFFGLRLPQLPLLSIESIIDTSGHPGERSDIAACMQYLVAAVLSVRFHLQSSMKARGKKLPLGIGDLELYLTWALSEALTRAPIPRTIRRSCR